MAVRGMQEAVVLQVVIHVGDEQVEDEASPQLLQVGGGVECMAANDFGDLQIASFIIPRGLQHGGRRLVGNAPAIRLSVEAVDEGDGNVCQLHDSRFSDPDAGTLGQFQGQHFATCDASGVANAGKLADGQTAVLVHQGAFGAHATQGCAPALQVAQVFVGLVSALDGMAGPEGALQGDEGRRGPAAGLNGTVPLAIRTFQPQRTNTGAVVHGQQVVQFGQCAQGRVFLTALGMVPRDDSSSPGIRCRVGQCAMKG